MAMLAVARHVAAGKLLSCMSSASISHCCAGANSPKLGCMMACKTLRLRSAEHSASSSLHASCCALAAVSAASSWVELRLTASAAFSAAACMMSCCSLAVRARSLHMHANTILRPDISRLATVIHLVDIVLFFGQLILSNIIIHCLSCMTLGLERILQFLLGLDLDRSTLAMLRGCICLGSGNAAFSLSIWLIHLFGSVHVT